MTENSEIAITAKDNPVISRKHFSAMIIVSAMCIQNSVRPEQGIEGPTALFVLRYLGANGHGFAETMIITHFSSERSRAFWGSILGEMDELKVEGSRKHSQSYGVRQRMPWTARRRIVGL